MSDNTTIEWADTTWGPVLGCDRVSDGCDNCYAITQAHIRAANPHPRVAAAFAGLTERTEHGVDWTGRINQLPDRLTQPFTWRKPRKVFVNSLSDLFHDGVQEAFVARVFAVMAATPQHTYQILTKRHGRMRSLLSSDRFPEVVTRALLEDPIFSKPGMSWPVPDGGLPWPLPNVWLGVSVEDQKRADLRIPALLDTPAAVRWISAEPLLGPVRLSSGLYDWDETDGVLCCRDHGMPDCTQSPQCNRIDWVVVGGESGPGARPMHPQWARDLRDQCTAAGVPFLFKQFGAWVPESACLHPGNAPAAFLDLDGTFRPLVNGKPETSPMARGDAITIRRVSKKAAGRSLDGRVWDEFPTTSPAVA